MTRGEIWTVAGGPASSDKPRPVVIVQDDRFDATESLTVCPVTTDATEAPLIRLRVEPAEMNGLRSSSSVMVDKVTTVRREQLGARTGRLDDEDMVRIGQALMVFLGLAG